MGIIDNMKDTQSISSCRARRGIQGLKLVRFREFESLDSASIGESAADTSNALKKFEMSAYANGALRRSAELQNLLFLFF